MAGQAPGRERWLPVVGFEGEYEVSDRGRVRSLDRILIHKNGFMRRVRGRLLTPYPITGGYLAFRARRRPTTVHSAVMAAFVGPRPHGMEILHWDGDPSNNHLENLRYGTPAENQDDSIRHGRHGYATRRVCPRNHRLVPPNLVPGRAKQGIRWCRACNRAKAQLHYYQKQGVVLDLQVESDRHYAQIMAPDPVLAPPIPGPANPKLTLDRARAAARPGGGVR
ncbi:NUMOD4 motif-containing HNH endonuclease [Pseudonocardia hispaniensis]|uniref:NUMOD4 motif-containing HNH endonuclease n=1 Tax=Pseudonocardia hispaniensis TaxID=904933 RepID=A0ABW1J8P0_9PSEU